MSKKKRALATHGVIAAIATLLSAPGLTQGTIPVGAKTAPPPPKPGQEEEWIEKWCSIGWREYGMDHIERCLNLLNERTTKTSEESTSNDAETPEQVRHRIESYRKRQAEREKRNEERRMARTARHWKPYGTIFIKTSSWLKDSNGNWVAEARFGLKPDETDFAPRFFAPRLECLDSNSPFCGIKGMIAVNCKSLLVNTYHPAHAEKLNATESLSKRSSETRKTLSSSITWGTWTRPEPETNYEQVIVDRCSHHDS